MTVAQRRQLRLLAPVIFLVAAGQETRTGDGSAFMGSKLNVAKGLYDSLCQGGPKLTIRSSATLQTLARMRFSQPVKTRALSLLMGCADQGKYTAHTDYFDRIKDVGVYLANQSKSSISICQEYLANNDDPFVQTSHFASERKVVDEYKKASDRDASFKYGHLYGAPVLTHTNNSVIKLTSYILGVETGQGTSSTLSNYKGKIIELYRELGYRRVAYHHRLIYGVYRREEHEDVTRVAEEQLANCLHESRISLAQAHND